MNAIPPTVADHLSSALLNPGQPLQPIAKVAPAAANCRARIALAIQVIPRKWKPRRFISTKWTSASAA